jgi:uncharacterized repeat protein (TIGR01451 family)
VWQLLVGDTVDGVEHYAGEWLNNAETSVFVGGLPQDGRVINVSLRYREAGSPTSGDHISAKRYEYIADLVATPDPGTDDPGTDDPGTVDFNVELDPTTFAHPGEKIVFRYTVTNTGNTLLTGVNVESSVLFNGNCVIGDIWTDVSVTCSGSYTVTSADVVAGEIAVTAALDYVGLASARGLTASATYDPSGKEDEPGISIRSGASSDSFSSVGERIDFDVTISNTSGEVVTDIVVSNPVTGNTVCIVGTLWPGYAAVCTEVRFVSQQDVDRGELRNVTEAVCLERPNEVVSTAAVVRGN